MHHLVRLLAMTALVACCSVALASAQADRAPRGKLPRRVVPLAYRLAFKVNPAQQTFSGATTIKVKLKQVSGHLWLDGRDLNVYKVTIMDAAGQTHDGKYVTVALNQGVAHRFLPYAATTEAHDAALARAAHDLTQTREQTLLCAALKARQDPAAILR